MISRLLVFGCFLFFFNSVLPAQTGSISGKISEKGSTLPVPGVTVTLKNPSDSTVVTGTYSDLLGRYLLSRVDAGRYTISFTCVGYREVPDSGVTIRNGESLVVDVGLEEVILNMDAVIVSASRRKEKAVDAPGSTSVIDAVTISSRPAVTPVDHLRSTAGIEIAQTGLMQQTVVARAFNNVFSTSLTMLTDNRIAAVPSLRANVPSFIPVVDEDIDHIEIVRGPASALYGPNAHNGVMNIVTRSPFASKGTTVSLAGGNRSLTQGTLRHAGTITDRIGYKISAQYFRGLDWEYTDPDEDSLRSVAIGDSALPDTLRIGKRERYVERFGGEARMDFILGTGGTLNFTAGMNQAVSTIELTDFGASQGRDWRYTYLQSRFTFGSLFVQAFLNLSDGGDSYFLRTGLPIVDRSTMFVAQAQNSTEIGSRQRFTYGADLLLTNPVTDGTINGRNEENDNIDEAGVYLQSETELLEDRVDLVLAGRADHHNRLEDIVFSPRAALVYKASTGHRVRLTYNRAYSTPLTTELFLDVLVEQLSHPLVPDLTFAVRGSGIPESGYTFGRDARGVLYFHSPLLPDKTQAIPVDAVTVLWPAVVALAADNGIDISSVPPPDTSDIHSVLRRYNESTESFDIVTDARDIPRLEPTITQTVEAGYVGTLDAHIRVAVDVYHTKVTNFIGQFEIITPNVFMNSSDLFAYLLNHGVSYLNAALLSAMAEMVPLGTVTPEGVQDPTAIVAAPRNFGNLNLWGTDITIEYMPDPSWTFIGTYSHIDQNYFAKLDGAEDLSLNTPKNRGSLTVRYRNTDLGIHAEVRGRWITGFRMMSGVYVGDVGAYTLFDVTAGAALPWVPGASITVSAENLLDRKHREFIGAPEIGRLLIGRVRYTL